MLLSAQPDGPPAVVTAPISAASSDSELAAWRDAAGAGMLPTPSRERWQVLRSGVVNLWEFDVAEYWFADGRAQFVGQNQSGKSTLMALTTLIMLAGDLGRELVDTFGEQHKSYRYYVEPTSDPTDRRDTDGSVYRGWAWVEYGRLVSGEPRYFTTLLYAQARRGAQDFVRTWATCEGLSRVSDGLTLHRDAATQSPSDLAGVPGFSAAGSGAEFKRRLTSGLFGFDDAERLDAVVRMLKVLRTPHLGQKLDPEFFTEQMREALPAIARSEIDQLAEGWDQLEQLAADRDSAQSARDAVANYVRRAWNPWADAVLRRRADDLVATNTRLDNVTRSVREADALLRLAKAERERLSRELIAADSEGEDVGVRYEQLLQSQAYRNAHDATANVGHLKGRAEERRKLADATRHDRDQAAGRVETRTGTLTTLAAELAAEEAKLQQAASNVTDSSSRAGLVGDYRAWALAADVDRLTVAVAERRRELAEAVRLLREALKSRAAEERAAGLLATAEVELESRRTAADRADTTLQTGLQELSDALEVWAGTLGAEAPPVSERTRWIDEVVAQARHERPSGVLGGLLIRQWLDPLTAPLREQAAIAEREAVALTRQATELDGEVEALQSEIDPMPAAPSYWRRRARGDQDAGAPFWRLVDPVPSLPSDVLDRLEAALAASGLLDAWITPDGVYLPDRDGFDNVVSITSSKTPGPTLADVFQPAVDAGDCAGMVAGLLPRVGYAAAESTPLTAAFALAADGRWRTPLTAGRAGAAEHGAELVGTAARAAARERKIALLRQEAARLREQASQFTATAAQLRGHILRREQDASDAPTDAAVVGFAIAAAAAATEFSKAGTRQARLAQQHREASVAAADANSKLLVFTGDHALPHEETPQQDLRTAIDAASTSIAALNGAAIRAASSRGRHATAATELDDAEAALRLLQQRLVTDEQTARVAKTEADAAESALGFDEQEILAAATSLKARRDTLRVQVKDLEAKGRDQERSVGTAQTRLETADADRQSAEEARDSALVAWWGPVDAGLARARNLPDAPARLFTHAQAQARTARETLKPAGWPDAAEATAEKDAKVSNAWAKLAGSELIALRAVLEASGGRSVLAHDADEITGLPAISILVDSSGTQVDPGEAIGRLEQQVAALAKLHDEKMQAVLVELLSSTFVEHLRERLNAVLELLARVNQVLAAHPTGASNTMLRLVRLPVAGQQDAFAVLGALEKGFIDDRPVQQQVRHFLEQQIREAQELGVATAREWKEHLADLLDYRRWFDVVTEYRVGGSPWKPLTKEVHAKDSGGGKVVTLLQPLLATLVALYDESDTAPRPLWLDEAFTGVDDENRATMLNLLVTFDLDFLLAAPSHLVTAAQVPAAAVWYITRAPAPDPGVDLSLSLWAGRQLVSVQLPHAGMGAAAAAAPNPAHASSGTPGLFDFDAIDPDP